jgi:hypothetical protein
MLPAPQLVMELYLGAIISQLQIEGAVSLALVLYVFWDCLFFAL